MSKVQLHTVREVVDALGGTKVLCELTHNSNAAISNWRAADQFPANTYVIIKMELGKINATAPDTLWSMKMVPAL